jgi:hypothetical protein
LYFDGNKGYFIPYDYDNTLGTGESTTLNVFQWGNAQTAPLIAKLLEFDEYRETYLNHLKELIDPAKDLFDVDKSIARIKGWHQMIGDYLQSDCILSEEATHTFVDRPASWGNMGYTILERNGMNFFEKKANTIRNSTTDRLRLVNPATWQVGFSGTASGGWHWGGIFTAPYSSTESNVTDQTTGAGTYVWTMDNTTLFAGEQFKLRIWKAWSGGEWDHVNDTWYGWEQFTITGDAGNFSDAEGKFGGNVGVVANRTYNVKISIEFDGATGISSTVNFEIVP